MSGAAGPGVGRTGRTQGADVFYCPPGNVGDGRLVIEGEEFSHMVHVMRKEAGDTIVVVDGRGSAWDATIQSIERRSAVCAIGPKRERNNEPALRVVVAAGILKNPSRFDFLVEKTTELGASEIIPMQTGRTIPDRARSGRWRKLALAAMKQSGRSWLPPVRDAAAFGDVLEEFRSCANRIIAHEEPGVGQAFGGIRVQPAPGPAPDAIVLVGPEGGFTPEEVAAAIGAGFETLYLGDRRLRTETAAVAAIAVLLR